MKINSNLKKYIPNRKYYRLPGSLFIFFSFLYLGWLLIHLNRDAILLAVIFLITQAFLLLSAALSIVNHWKATYRTERPPLPAALPSIAIVVSTYKEPINVLERTVKSLLTISYKGEVVILVSNDDRATVQKKEIKAMMYRLSEYWNTQVKSEVTAKRDLHLIHTQPHQDAKAGNLNQAVSFFRKYYPHIDLVLTQDADEIVSSDILDATAGYFSEKPNVAFVQTVKQAATHKSDPFGNNDYMWYGRTAASRDASNAMFACGSGVVWRISALESVGGFSTWNLVEDLTTSYNLFKNGWESRYHFEALSIGLAPEDLANFIKQRGTWALDTMRLFFWDNPFKHKSLTIQQKLQFLELPMFYLTGLFTIVLILLTTFSLFTETWPTTATSFQHAIVLLPGFIFLELYYILLAGNIKQYRIRQFWLGLAPVFTKAVFQALLSGPNNKPIYRVTSKTNFYANYLHLILPQLALLLLLVLGIGKTIVYTPIYSRFDWAIFFWGLYQASFFMQIVTVAWWKWIPQFKISYSLFELLGTQTKVSRSYKPDSAYVSVSTKR